MKAIVSSPEEMRERANKYFATNELWSICDLVESMGFCSRQSLVDYEKRPDYSDTVKWLRMKIEGYYERLGQAGKNPAFAIFALKNFNWTDRQEIAHSGTIDGVIRLPQKKDIGAPVELDTAPKTS
jgi:hypothetical protein